MSYLTYEEYKDFYLQYGRKVDYITKDVHFLSEKQLKVAYDEYKKIEKSKIKSSDCQNCISTAISCAIPLRTIQIKCSECINKKMIGDNKEMKQNCDSGKMPKINKIGIGQLDANEVYVDVDDELTITQRAIEKVGKSLTNFIIEKNKNYGNSALEPLKIFSKHITSVDDINECKEFDAIVINENNRRRSLNLMLTRLDDKLSRIKNAKELRKNDVSDILGYLILVCVNLGWDNFDELID